MIQVFIKRYSQTDCSIFLKILYLAPGSPIEFCTNMGFFVQSQIYHLQLSVILFRCVTFFAVFHSPHKVLIPETILTRRLITKAKTIPSSENTGFFKFPVKLLVLKWPFLSFLYSERFRPTLTYWLLVS